MRPPLDAQTWLKMLVGVAVILAAPGLLTVAWRQRRPDVLTTASWALAAGVLLVAVVSYGLSLAGVALHWWTVLPLAVGLAVVVRLARGAIQADDSAPPPVWAVASACALMVIVVVAGYAGYDAPCGDAMNHAFMTRRIAQTHSVAQQDVFAAPFGSPGFIYLMGWHASAALVAGAFKVPPHVAAGVLPLICLALLPAALVRLWRRCGVPAAAAVWGAVFLVANRSFPAGVLQWGAFGHVVGWLCVPVAALALFAALTDGGWRRGLLAGLSLIGLLLVHAAELPVVFLLVWCCWLAHRRDHPGATPRWGGAAFAVALFAAAAALTLAVTGLRYGAEAAPGAVEQPWRELGRALDTLNRAGWSWGPMRIVIVAGLILGWRSRALRPLAAIALATGALYVTLAAWRDPVSRLLASPFYQEKDRLLALQMFFLAPLIGVAVTAWLEWMRARRRLGWLVIAAVLLPGIADNWRFVRAHAHAEPWSAQQYALARRLPDLVAPGEVIANVPHDGSGWAWQVSGSRFLQPAAWPLWSRPGELRRPPRVLGLLANPWPATTRSLREEGVAFVWVGDRWDHRASRELVQAGWGRGAFAGDPRFEAVASCDDATLYRIRW